MQIYMTVPYGTKYEHANTKHAIIWDLKSKNMFISNTYFKTLIKNMILDIKSNSFRYMVVSDSGSYHWGNTASILRSIHSSDELNHITCNDNVLWTSALNLCIEPLHCGLMKCLIYKFLDLAFLGQHYLQVKTPNKGNTCMLTMRSASYLDQLYTYTIHTFKKLSM